MVARAIKEGEIFADIYARHAPLPIGPTRRRLPQTLERLGQGEVFDERDDTCIRAIGGALVEATNARCNGYGNRVLKDCTHEDVIMDAQLETLRWLLLKWDSF